MKKTISEAITIRNTQGEMISLLSLQENFYSLLKPIEIKIIQARENYLSYSQLSDEARRTCLNDLILNGIVSFQTSSIPNKQYHEALISMFDKQIRHVSNYRNYTEAEFVLVILLNGIPKKELPNSIEIETQTFRGNVFGLELFSKLLLNYKAVRDLIDRKAINFLDGAGEGTWLN